MFRAVEDRGWVAAAPHVPHGREGVVGRRPAEARPDDGRPRDGVADAGEAVVREPPGRAAAPEVVEPGREAGGAGAVVGAAPPRRRVVGDRDVDVGILQAVEGGDGRGAMGLRPKRRRERAADDADAVGGARELPGHLRAAGHAEDIELRGVRELDRALHERGVVAVVVPRARAELRAVVLPAEPAVPHRSCEVHLCIAAQFAVRLEIVRVVVLLEARRRIERVGLQRFGAAVEHGQDADAVDRIDEDGHEEVVAAPPHVEARVRRLRTPPCARAGLSTAPGRRASAPEQAPSLGLPGFDWFIVSRWGSIDLAKLLLARF